MPRLRDNTNPMPREAALSRRKPSKKPVGINNRGKNLAGRGAPADTTADTSPIVRSPSGSPVKAESWTPRDLSFADSQFDEAFDRKDVYDQLNALMDWDEHHVGFQIGRLSESPRMRRKTRHSWWVFRWDLFKQFLKHLKTKVRWPVARAALVLFWFYYLGYGDERVYEETRLVLDEKIFLEDFPTVKAAKSFRQRLITMGFEMFGADPEAKPASVWGRDRLHEYAPGEGMNPAAPDWQKDWTETQLPRPKPEPEPEPKPELDPEPDPEPVVTGDSSNKE